MANKEKIEASVLARYIIKYSRDVKNISITNLKLQKLLYFAWLENYRQNKTQLFEDTIFAWPLGPVVANVYFDYNYFGGMNININTDDCDDEGIMSRVNDLLGKYIKYDALQLVNKSHTPGWSWDHKYNALQEPRGIIPFELIKRLEGSVDEK